MGKDNKLKSLEEYNEDMRREVVIFNVYPIYSPLPPSIDIEPDMVDVIDENFWCLF